MAEIRKWRSILRMLSGALMVTAVGRCCTSDENNLPTLFSFFPPLFNDEAEN